MHHPTHRPAALLARASRRPVLATAAIANAVIAAALLALLSVGAAAQNVDVAARPYDSPDDTFITLNGTVASVRPDSFVLDFGGGEIVVEMGEGGLDLGDRGLNEGDAVSVFGVVDDGIFASRTIDAAGVYVDRLNRTFYASTVGEHDARQRSFLELSRSRNPFQTVVQGRVTDVSANQDALTLATGSETLDVRLEPNALIQTDELAERRIEVGDRVSVTGRIDENFFAEREIVASIVQVIEN